MDREKKQRWDWLPQQMPGVARQLAEKRRELGDAWVNECWKRGVVNREPGWFYAAEGALMVGTLDTDPNVIAFATGQVTKSQVLVMLRTKGAADATN